MKETQEHLQDLREIRNIMEKSSRFISLSGLSGIFAGIFALLGAAAAYIYLKDYKYSREANSDFLIFFFLDAGLVLILALASGIFFTVRQAKRKGQKIWDKTSKRLIFNMAIPLITGGLFCLALIKTAPELIAPATLIFYGLAVLNGSKFTLDDIRYLGYCEIVLGLTCILFPYRGLYFWAAGFGLLHIIYGAAMYFKYEK